MSSNFLGISSDFANLGGKNNSYSWMNEHRVWATELWPTKYTFQHYGPCANVAADFFREPLRQPGFLVFVSSSGCWWSSCLLVTTKPHSNTHTRHTPLLVTVAALNAANHKSIWACDIADACNTYVTATHRMLFIFTVITVVIIIIITLLSLWSLAVVDVTSPRRPLSSSDDCAAKMLSPISIACSLHPWMYARYWPIPVSSVCLVSLWHIPAICQNG